MKYPIIRLRVLTFALLTLATAFLIWTHARTRRDNPGLSGQTAKAQQIWQRYWSFELVGRQLRVQNDYADAGAYFSRALVGFQRIGALPQIASCDADLGNLYMDLGRYQQALASYSRANAITRCFRLDKLSPGDRGLVHRDQAADLFGLAAAAIARDNFALGNSCLDSAEKLCADVGVSFDNAALLCGIDSLRGDMAREQGNPAQALSLHLKALTQARRNFIGLDLAQAHSSLGQDYLDLKQYDNAGVEFGVAYKISKSLKSTPMVVQALCGLAQISEERKDNTDAVRLLGEAVRCFETLFSQVKDPTHIGDLQSTQNNIYGSFALAQALAGDDKAALVVAERGRSRGLAMEVARNFENLSRFCTPEESRLLNSLLKEKERCDNAMSGQNRSVPRGNVAAQFVAAAKKYEDYRSFLLARHFVDQCPFEKHAPGWNDFDALAKRNPDTLYVEYALAGRRSILALCLSRYGARAIVLPSSQRDVALLAKSWRESITQCISTEPQDGAGLYKAIVSPIEPVIDAHQFNHLVFVPDGPLQDVPFVALCDGGRHRLLDRYAVSTAASLGMLTWSHKSRDAKHDLLCVVDSASGSHPSPECVDSTQRGGPGALKYAAMEGDLVSRYYPDHTLLKGPQASVSAVKQMIGDYNVLHFATHGFLDSGDGLQSWLFLAHKPGGSDASGRLEAREIVQIPLAARLAVLSACQTGNGQSSGGEGLLGLSWAFRAAGCRSVVGSQWSVDDRPTSLLMDRFYASMARGRPVDEALASAMKAVRASNGGAYSNPYCWAGFQIFGETEPIVPRKR